MTNTRVVRREYDLQYLVCCFLITMIVLFSSAEPIYAVSPNVAKEAKSRANLVGVPGAKRYLDFALNRAMTMEDPLPCFRLLLDAGMNMDPEFGLVLAEKIKKELAQKTMSHNSSSYCSALAECVASYDNDLRDDFLRMAILGGQNYSPTEENWDHYALMPKGRWYGDVHWNRDLTKEYFSLRVSLWSIITGPHKDKEKRIQDLMELAELKTYDEFQISIADFQWPLRRELGNLDPDLLITSWPNNKLGACRNTTIYIYCFPK